jgi:hypothetical protein
MEVPSNTPHHVVQLSTIATEDVRWLWRDRIASGKLTLLDGDPGLGKSTLTLAIAAAVSAGKPMPGESAATRPAANVLIIAVEDGVGDTVKPRLEAAGANLDRIFCFTSPVCLRDDLVELQRLIEKFNIAMVIIDPLMAVLGADASNDQKCRSVLTPLGDIATKTGAAVLMVRHLTKAGSRSALHRGGGSMAIIGAARLALLFSRDPSNPEMRVLAVTKSNLGPIAPSVRFVLGSAEGPPTLTYAGTVKHDADALLANPGDPERRTAIDEADEFLRDLLANGPMPANEIIKAGTQAGISNATLRRAKARLRVTPVKMSFDSGWSWVLPAAANDEQSVGTHEVVLATDTQLAAPEASMPTHRVSTSVAVAAADEDAHVAEDAHGSHVLAG